MEGKWRAPWLEVECEEEKKQVGKNARDGGHHGRCEEEKKAGSYGMRRGNLSRRVENEGGSNAVPRQSAG